jgi:hypothetical protein
MLSSTAGFANSGRTYYLMILKIEQENSSRQSFDEYRYNIYDDGILIARYGHDYRGDDHGIDFVNGTNEFWPVGRMAEFVEGGGPSPLVLTERAISYIEQKLRR